MPCLEQVAEDRVQFCFVYLQKWRSKYLPEQPVPVLGHLHCNNYICIKDKCFSRISCIIVCLLLIDWIPLRIAWLHFLHSLLSGIYKFFIHLHKIPLSLLFLRLSVPVLGLSACVRYSKLSTIFRTICWTPVCPCLSCTGLLSWGHSAPDVFSPVGRGE